MGLLPLLTRDQVAPELPPLWDEFLVWSGIYPHVEDVHPRVIHRLRRQLFARRAECFSPRQIEEMVWRITQCVAFNWHNDFLELDVEPGVPVRRGHAAAGLAAAGPDTRG